MALALSARIWGLNDFPTSLPTDQGSIGLYALRILHENWRPGLETLQFQTPFPLEFYSLAGWFGLFDSSPLTFRLFFIFLSLASLPLAYRLFRRLAGPRIALLSLFFLAVMRWDWTEARGGHSSAEAPFYLLAMVVLFYEGSRKGKTILLIASALFAGLGLYAYQSLKALPLLFAALTVFEFKRSDSNQKGKGESFKAALLLILVMAAPLIFSLPPGETLGKRESEVFILNKILEQKSLAPLLSSWRGTALMLNREGTIDPLHNLPGRRILDDGTAVLFLLGLGWVWRLRKTESGAYSLLGLSIMALPGLLAIDPGPPHRFTGLMPFVAFIAAWGGIGLWKSLFLWAKDSRPWLTGTACFFLFAVGAQNALTYFHLQAHDARCREASGLEQNQIGTTIEKLEQKKPGEFIFSIGPFYFLNPTVDFIAYNAKEDLRMFDPAGIAANQFPRDKPTVFFLEEDQTGVLGFLKNIFPGGREEKMKNEAGLTILLRYNAPPESFRSFQGWNRGLNGTYESAGEGHNTLSFSRTDPLVNFSSLEDLLFSGSPPYLARWTGIILAPLGGIYQFQVLTLDQAFLRLDGRGVALEKPLYLSPGSHNLHLEFHKEKGFYSELHLIWKKPGFSEWEVIPAEAFGKIDR